MNLILDIGNTRIKAALFNSKELIWSSAYSTLLNFSSEIKNHFSKIEASIIGSVADHTEEVIQILSPKKPLVFKNDTPIPLKNLYKSQATLGSDRLAAAIGAYSLFQHQNVLTIDAGTCIKYNFVNSGNEYLGGGISPGLQMRFKALHQYTDKLPLVHFEPDFIELIGDTTQHSILSGVLTGIIAEVEGIIDRYKKQYPDLIVVVTGGDIDFLKKRLKNHIFAEPNLILIGLNEILLYQKST